MDGSVYLPTTQLEQKGGYTVVGETYRHTWTHTHTEKKTDALSTDEFMCKFKKRRVTLSPKLLPQ